MPTVTYHCPGCELDVPIETNEQDQVVAIQHPMPACEMADQAYLDMPGFLAAARAKGEVDPPPPSP